MRKLYFVLAVLPLALTGCLKSEGYTSKLGPVATGVEIYNYLRTQNDIAVQPADVGIRLAMLLAEAESQNGMDDLNSVIVGGVGVKNALFGRATTIEKTANGYKITYLRSHGDNDMYERNGVFYITTNGAAQLTDTEVVGQKKWVVSVSGDAVTLKQGSWLKPLYISGGSTVLYNAGNGVYRMDLSGIEVWNPDLREIKSRWTGGFNWKPADARLIYSQCIGKESLLSGEAGGETFMTLNNSTPARMWYRLDNGRRHATGILIGGTEEGGLTSTADYDITKYPSPNVKIVWSYDDTSGLSYVVTWNGISVSMP